MVAELETISSGLNDPIDVKPEQTEEFPAHHGDFGGVNAVGAEDGTATTLSALVKVVEPFLYHIDGERSGTGKPAKYLAHRGEAVAIDRT